LVFVEELVNFGVVTRGVEFLSSAPPHRAGTADALLQVRNFKKSLIQMFACIGKDCVFYETVMHIKKNPHTCIECVPVAKR